MIGGPRSLAPQVPFAGKESLVAGITQCFREREFLLAQIALVIGRQMTVMPSRPPPVLAGSIADPRRDAVFRGILAGQNARPRRATNLAGRVPASELHPRGGDAVDLGTLVVRGPFVAQIPPSQIIGQDENDIGFLIGCARGECKDE